MNVERTARIQGAVRRISRADPLHASLAIACTIHVIAALVVGPGSAGRVVTVVAVESQGAELAIDVEYPSTSTSGSPVGGSAPNAPDSAQLASRPAPQTSTSTSTSTTGSLAFALNPAFAPTPTPSPIASADDWSFSATTNAAQRDVLAATALGLLPTRDTPVPQVAEVPRRAANNGGLVDGLDAHDRELGLGRGGPVLSAVEEAARTPGETPPEGSADYEIVVRRSGGVKVALLAANDSRSSWVGIMPEIERGVSARAVRLPDSAAGMRFVVHVDAVVQWPDGRRPAKVGTKSIATTGEVGSSESHPGLDFTRVPMVGVYHAGKVCSGGVVLTPGMLMAGGACSPENIGQPAARIVHGRVVSESRL